MDPLDSPPPEKTTLDASSKHVTFNPTHTVHQIRAGSPHLTSTTSSGLERRACRICQSETGEMVRPCGCAGTMGDIHEMCLSKWVAHSNNANSCEICKETYEKSGSQLKPLHQWTRPKIETSDAMRALTICGIVFSVWYVVSLMEERAYVDRIFRRQYPHRGDDIGRLLLLLVFCVCLFGQVWSLLSIAKAYVKRQKHIRFVDKPCNEAAVTNQPV